MINTIDRTVVTKVTIPLDTVAKELAESGDLIALYQFLKTLGEELNAVSQASEINRDAIYLLSTDLDAVTERLRDGFGDFQGRRTGLNL